MFETITKVITWIKSNYIVAALIGIAIVIMFFSRQVKKLLFGTRRVRHRRVIAVTRRRRSLPRSVGIRRNKPAVRRRSTGKVKKPWQIKGSLAAKRHMAQIRRRR